MAGDQVPLDQGLVIVRIKDRLFDALAAKASLAARDSRKLTVMKSASAPMCVYWW
jgi:hypothetical protein